MTNVTPKLLDWHEVEPGKTEQRHCYLLTFSGNERHYETVEMARKYVVLINWSNNAPCIPMIVGFLFDGARRRG